ncbi:MAG: hypothetical protein KC636_06365 [Myxococcales bacterium]|nr:hypothetical protein [Myxococcales bacterium]
MIHRSPSSLPLAALLAALIAGCGAESAAVTGTDGDATAGGASTTGDATVDATTAASDTDATASSSMSGASVSTTGVSVGTEATTDETATEGQEPLALDIETPDGACVDLSVTDRDTYAVRFTASGPPGAIVRLMAARAECAVDPFEYQQLALDDAGVGVFDIFHDGGADCFESLLGGWTAWIELDGETSPTRDVSFANAVCADASSCAAADMFCPSEQAPPFIPKEQLFVLSDAERPVFDPPDPGWIDFGMAYESYPLKNLWEAFDAGAPVVPLDPLAGPAGWYELDGTGSQNHALLWLGVAALGYALADDAAMFEVAAERCLLLLDLDAQQGHMRHEAIGQYAGFWEGGVATMALAGLYAPEGAPSGPALLDAARAWWADHTAALRALATPDRQVTLIGARLPGEPGEQDSWVSLSAAINLQLIDPRPHDQLHPTIAQFLTPAGEPSPVDSGVPCRWYRGRHVSERWVVLRAVQSGAILPVPAEHPTPTTATQVSRWTEGDTLHTATDAVTGYRPARWHVTWKPGSVIQVELGDPSDQPTQGKGPHPPPAPLSIPGDAAIILGPGG